MVQIINDCLTEFNSAGRVFCIYAGRAFIQSALLVLLLFALDLVLRKRIRAVVRYCLWLLVLVKLVLPPALALPTGIGYWLGRACRPRLLCRSVRSRPPDSKQGDRIGPGPCRHRMRLSRAHRSRRSQSRTGP